MKNLLSGDNLQPDFPMHSLLDQTPKANLARPGLDHKVSTLTDGSSLLGEGLRGSGIGGLEVMLFVRHGDCGTKGWKD